VTLWDGGVVEARGVGYPLSKDVLFGPPKDWYIERTGSLDPTCTPLVPEWAGDKC
jgi:hypothetical protein